MVFLLFCIAQVSVATIDRLLRASEHPSFSLVRDPAQPSLDPRCTRPPVEPFDTGFLNYDREQIREFIAWRFPVPPNNTVLELGSYALLDARSAEDDTVVIGRSFLSIRDRDPETMTEDELIQWEEDCEANLDAPNDIWREFRVKFEEARMLTTTFAIETDFTQKLYNDDFIAANTDDQGVFGVVRAEQAFEAACAAASYEEDDEGSE